MSTLLPAQPWRTRFILLNTSHAGNVGAAARAIKVMGFGDMVLVAPRWANVLRREETIQRASGALDVLANARIVDTLDEALDGMTHLCATAMTPRDFGPPTVAPREHFESLLKKELLTHISKGLQPDLIKKNEGGTAENGVESEVGSEVENEQGMAFLFGSERFGMTNDDVYRCHACLSIPTNPSFGSLNLAAALQVIAYEWRLALMSRTGKFDDAGVGTERMSGAISKSAAYEPPASASSSSQTAKAALADAQQVSGMLAHLEKALVAIDFLDPAAPKKLMPRLNQLFNRADLTQEEIHILRGVAKAMLDVATRASTSTSGPSKG